jgi:hypothetical protein
MKLRAQALMAARLAYGAEMVDAFKVMVTAVDQDDSGGTFRTYTLGEEVPCIFSALSASEQARQDSTLFTVAARLRVPLGTAVTRNDRVSVTKLWGDVLETPREFEVAGDPRETVGYLLVELSEVTT